MIVVSTILVLLTAALIVYKSFALYEQKNSFEIVNGQVPDQNYDAMLTFYLDDGEGNQSFVESMPTENGHNYEVTVTCNNGATGEWDYNAWEPNLHNITISRTKCKLIFGPPLSNRPLKEYGIYETVVTNGNGLYEVTHEDANITYTSNTTSINNLKQTEYRYAGATPNNYVTFNGEEAGWRIIGLVNTPEGQRIKLVRASSIGDYSWDSSPTNLNGGYGVNEWSKADIMTTLNSGAYYNRTSGTCYNEVNNATTSCNFSSNGLTSEAKEMIDTITWNTGSNGNASEISWTTLNMYNYERSSNTGKDLCSSGQYCNDTVKRTTTWKGQIGLMYPSDYGYATSGGATTNRDTCMATNLGSWNSYSECYGNDWIYNNSNTWLLTPIAISSHAIREFILLSAGNVNYHNAYNALAVFPALYLKLNVKAVSGDGTSSNPYVLSV